jgi:hypothetical protein
MVGCGEVLALTLKIACVLMFFSKCSPERAERFEYGFRLGRTERCSSLFYNNIFHFYMEALEISSHIWDRILSKYQGIILLLVISILGFS